MNRAEFGKHMDNRLGHVLQCQQRAVDADRHLEATSQWHRTASSVRSTTEQEKATNAATAAHTTLAAAKTEFLDGLYDALNLLVTDWLEIKRGERAS